MTEESGMKERCGWARGDQLLVDYHDREWGMPLHDDQGLFEFLVLEGFQAGLSWLTILRKRENYRNAFDRFDPAVVAQYDEEKIGELMGDTGIVRNNLKIRASIANAIAFLDVQDEFGSFNTYIWQFAGGRPIHNKWRHLKEIPSTSGESEAMSQDLKRRGFSFAGPTICYAFMQAVGMVNDHLVNCYRYRQLRTGK